MWPSFVLQGGTLATSPSPSRKSWIDKISKAFLSLPFSDSTHMMPSLPLAACCWNWVLIILVRPISHMPTSLLSVLAERPGVTLWNSNKKPFNLSEKSGNITGFTQVSADYLSGSVWFNWLSWICSQCQEKSSSLPKMQMPQPTQALECTCNLCSEARLMPVKASAGFWPRTNVPEVEAAQRGWVQGRPTAVGVSVPTLEMLSLKWPRQVEVRLNSWVYSKLWFLNYFDCGPIPPSKRPCGPPSPLIPTFQWERIW